MLNTFSIIIIIKLCSILQADSIGVWGTAAGVWGTAAGVWDTAAGVWGTAAGVWGTAAGVWGTAAGVWGTAAGVWGTAAGVWGTGTGVWIAAACVWSTAAGVWVTAAAGAWGTVSVEVRASPRASSNSGDGVNGIEGPGTEDTICTKINNDEPKSRHCNLTL